MSVKHLFRPFPKTLSAPFPRRDPAGLQRLRDRIQRIETGGAPGKGVDGRPVLPFGVAEIDDHLPWGGLPRGALHEINAGDAGAGAATGFATALVGRLMRGGSGRVLWCGGSHTLDAGVPYAPGLRRFGVDPDRLIVVRANRPQDALWSLEEGLACNGLVAVIGEIEEASLTETRRLQLAAEASGVTALLLRPRTASAAPSAALTRWRVFSFPSRHRPSPPPGHPQDTDVITTGEGRNRDKNIKEGTWRADLFRCRGGEPHEWEMTWRHETGDFALAAPLRDRPAAASVVRLAG